MTTSDMSRTMVGSPIYMAPEILGNLVYNAKADVWSLGVVLFEMLFGKCPFEARDIEALKVLIKNSRLIIPKHINNISQNTETLLKKMLVYDFHKRSTIREI